jgi:acyl dehydratase
VGEPAAQVQDLEPGAELGVSDWVTLGQATIDAHAEVTGDRHWIHNDPDRATREGPFGAPIAQGSLLLGNLVRMQEQVIRTVDDIGLAYALNYGFDRVRFIHPVRAGPRWSPRGSASSPPADRRVAAVRGLCVLIGYGDDPSPGAADVGRTASAMTSCCTVAGSSRRSPYSSRTWSIR